MTDVIKTIHDLQLSLTPHANSRSLADHLIRVGRLLESSNECREVISAGYLHSIYGRQFTRFKNPVDYADRQTIVNVVGEVAEELCYLNCATNNDSFWYTLNFDPDDRHVILDRFTNEKRAVSKDTLIKLFRINFANMIDHLEPSLRQHFRWNELSLFIQNFHLLSAGQQKLFDTTFNLQHQGVAWK